MDSPAVSQLTKLFYYMPSDWTSYSQNVFTRVSLSMGTTPPLNAYSFLIEEKTYIIECILVWLPGYKIKYYLYHAYHYFNVIFSHIAKYKTGTTAFHKMQSYEATYFIWLALKVDMVIMKTIKSHLGWRDQGRDFHHSLNSILQGYLEGKGSLLIFIGPFGSIPLSKMYIS